MNKLFLIAAFALIMTVSFAVDANPNCETPGPDADSCTECDAGYGVKSGGTEAEPANTCAKCTVDNCLLCDGDTPGTCETCNAGYGLVDSKCTKCSADVCLQCNSDISKCTLCKAGYALEDGEGTTLDTCTACANGCSACTKTTDSCAACPTGHAKNDTDKDAVFCCSNTNCTACSTVDKCTACATGVNLDADNGTCFGFKSGASLTLGAILSVALFSLLF